MGENSPPAVDTSVLQTIGVNAGAQRDMEVRWNADRSMLVQHLQLTIGRQQPWTCSVLVQPSPTTLPLLTKRAIIISTSDSIAKRLRCHCLGPRARASAAGVAPQLRAQSAVRRTGVGPKRGGRRGAASVGEHDAQQCLPLLKLIRAMCCLMRRPTTWHWRRQCRSRSAPSTGWRPRAPSRTL